METPTTGLCLCFPQHVRASAFSSTCMKPFYLFPVPPVFFLKSDEGQRALLGSALYSLPHLNQTTIQTMCWWELQAYLSRWPLLDPCGVSSISQPSTSVLHPSAAVSSHLSPLLASTASPAQGWASLPGGRLRPGPCTCTASHGFKPGCLQGNRMPGSPGPRTKYLSPFLMNSPPPSHLTLTHCVVNIHGHG